MRRSCGITVGFAGLALFASIVVAQESIVVAQEQSRPLGNVAQVSAEPSVCNVFSQGDYCTQTEPCRVAARSSQCDAEAPWLTAGNCGGNCGGNCSCCCAGSCWYVQAEALFMQRDNQNANQPVVLDDASQAVLFSTSDLSLDGAVGRRNLLGRAFDDYSALEFSYFGVFDWTAGATIRGSNSLDIPPDLVGPATDFDNADDMAIAYCTQVNNVEANGVSYLCGSRQCGGVAMLAGFRYVNLDETFNINSIDNDGTQSDYRIDAENHLFGGQLGLRLTHRSCRWGFDSTGKVGLFGNAANQRQFVGDNGNTTVLRNTSSSQSVTSFVGDINASVAYYLTDVWKIRAGYNVLWMEGLALAPNQLDFSFSADSGTAVSTGGGVFLHGANVGLEARW